MDERLLQQYHDQTLLVDDLISHHPEFGLANDPDFSPDERWAFQVVFQPNWSNFNDDYRAAFKYFQEHSPELFTTSQLVLKKFLAKHGVIANHLFS